MTQPIILVLGPQGSGKGTQAELISKRFNIPSVAAGDLFRAIAQRKSDTGKLVKAILDVGGLMTIDLWEEVVGVYLDSIDMKNGFIFDGVVRSLKQVEAFEKILKRRKLPEPIVISIVLDDKTALERLLKRGRNDDTIKQIKERLSWSRSQAQPAIDWYKESGRLIEVNGNQTIEAVHAEIVKKLLARSKE